MSLLEWGAKAAIEVFMGKPEDKQRAQDQLRPVLERRFEPCLHLWQELWRWADETVKALERGKAEEQTIASGKRLPADLNEMEAIARSASEAPYRKTEISRLSEVVDKFLIEHGALVSYPCLSALQQFQRRLRLDVEGDELSERMQAVDLHNRLFQSDKTDENGRVVGKEPGLLLLLRDELGSNVKAASSVLKG